MNRITFSTGLFLSLIPSSATSQEIDQERPNILFCIADDATFYHFGVAGCSWVNTPNFDQAAKDGLFVENCYTPNAKSAPSRACVLTGRNSWQLGAAGNHINRFPSDIKVFTEALSENGYTVAYTGKGCEPCDAGMKDGKERELTGVAYNEFKCDKLTKWIAKVDYPANFDSFLSSRDEDKPFFFWFGSHQPHRRYEYMSGIEKAQKSIDMIKDLPPFWPDTDSVRIDMLDYALEIEEFDRELGDMFDLLKEHGVYDNTLIIITADNGMPFPRCKANNYEFSSHMPFVMLWKDGIVDPGRTVDEYVSFIDIAPTILDYAGVEWSDSGMLDSPGCSLRSIVENKMSKREFKHRESLLFGRERDDYGRPNNEGYPIRAILRDDILYIWNCESSRMPAGPGITGYLDVDGSPTKSYILDQNRAGDSEYYNLSFAPRPEEEMYILSDDPYCVDNVAADERYAKTKERLRKELISRLKSQDDPRMFNNGDVFDQYPYMGSGSWDFYERVVSGEILEPWKKTGWVNNSDYEQYND